MDTEVYKLRESKPYQVQWGYQCDRAESFATFGEALAFYRGFLACERWDTHNPSNDGPRLVNIDNIDGAEDASAAAQLGLTADEWERVQEVG